VTTPVGRVKYSDEQPRDDHGQWTDGGGGSANTNPKPPSLVVSLATPPLPTDPNARIPVWQFKEAAREIEKHCGFPIEVHTIKGTVGHLHALEGAGEALAELRTKYPELYSSLRKGGVGVEVRAVTSRYGGQNRTAFMQAHYGEGAFDHPSIILNVNCPVSTNF
jgi:hypothetical protein